MTGETTDAAAINVDESKHTQTVDRQSELRATCQDELVSSVLRQCYENHKSFSKQLRGPLLKCTGRAFLLQSGEQHRELQMPLWAANREEEEHSWPGLLLQR